MNDFIICLIKYTSTFICILYTYAKLMRIKLKIWDTLAIPLFAVFSSVLYITTVYIKILVPIGLFIFSVVFLYLRFKNTFYETITVSAIALGLAIVFLLLSFFVAIPITITLNFINNETLKISLAQLIVGLIQILVIWLLFKIKRFQSGVYPKSKNASFEIGRAHV